jgi:hypothetical protein
MPMCREYLPENSSFDVSTTIQTTPGTLNIITNTPYIHDIEVSAIHKKMVALKDIIGDTLDDIINLADEYPDDTDNTDKDQEFYRQQKQMLACLEKLADNLLADAIKIYGDLL